MTRVSILGSGYVGLVTGSCLADLGHTVTCLETDLERLARLQDGHIPFYEQGLVELFERNRSAGRLRVTDDYLEGVTGAEVVMIAVNTPPREDGSVDTRFVFAAASMALPYLGHGAVLVVKSTVPPGTGDYLEQLVADAGRDDVRVVSNPEFLREGSAVLDFMEPDRIVVGAADAEAAALVAGLYRSLPGPLITCARRAAELAKYACNAYLATRISFMNEIAEICGASGIDVEEVEQVLGSDHRIGPAFLKAGLGWGGSCFPKDTRGMISFATAHDCEPRLVRAAFEVNARQRMRAFERLLAAVNHVADPAVAVLGLAFKPDTDDVREAPALEIAASLLDAGIRVQAFDPLAMDGARRLVPGATYAPDPYEAVRGADALLIATEWSFVRELDWARVGSLMRQRVVLDGRNALDPAHMDALGFTYLAFGRSPVRAARAAVLESDAAGS